MKKRKEKKEILEFVVSAKILKLRTCDCKSQITSTGDIYRNIYRQHSNLVEGSLRLCHVT